MLTKSLSRSHDYSIECVTRSSPTPKGSSIPRRCGSVVWVVLTENRESVTRLYRYALSERRDTRALRSRVAIRIVSMPARHMIAALAIDTQPCRHLQ